MLHGNAKRREMARTLLPSTNRRQAAGALAEIRRRGRRQVTQQLRDLRGPASLVAERWDGSTADARAWPQRAIKDAVWERRRFDKVNPFQKWAVAITADVPAPERLDLLRGAVPYGVMGRHALSHVEWLDHFSGHRPRPSWYPRPAAPARPEFDHAAVLRAVVADGRLGEFNRWMKQPRFALDREGGPVARTLAGAHDVDAFVEDCRRRSASSSARYAYGPPSPWFDGLRAWAAQQQARPVAGRGYRSTMGPQPTGSSASSGTDAPTSALSDDSGPS